MTGRLRFFLIIFSLGLLAGGCSDSTHSWKAQGVDLQKYKTYAWIAPGDSALNTRRDDKVYAGSIQHFANEELKKKGMVLDATSPDAVFMFDTRLEDRTRYSQSPSLSVGVGFGGPGYYMGGSVPVAGGQVNAVPYKEGTLIIEMFDLRTKEPVWRAWSSKSIDARSDIEEEIRSASHSIFFYFPKRKN